MNKGIKTLFFLTSLAIFYLNTYGQDGYSPPCDEVNHVKIDTSPSKRCLPRGDFALKAKGNL